MRHGQLFAIRARGAAAGWIDDRWCAFAIRQPPFSPAGRLCPERCHDGNQAISPVAIPTLHLEAKPVGWAVTFEMAMKAQFAGWKLGEVPVISIDRLYGGKSTFRLGPWTGEYLRWFIWGCRHLRHVP